MIAYLLLLVMMLTLVAPGAYAEGPFRMAGYDHEDTSHIWETNFFFARMQELTGVAIQPEQYMTADSWAAAKAAMFSEGGDMPDALFKANLTTQETVELYEAGKLIDLRPYLAENCPNLMALLTDHPEWEKDITLPDGAIVALPAIDELQFNNGMWINTKWLSTLGLSMPTTAEELTAVLRAFKNDDPNMNGKRDEVPLTFSSLWDLRFLAHAYGINANDYYITTDENGTVSEILTSDANRAFLTWLNELWAEGLLDETGFSGLRTLNQTNSDEDASIVYGVLFASSPIELVPSTALAQYHLLPPLTYADKQVYRDLTGDTVRGTFAITSACKDPASLLKWVDVLYTEEGFILAEAGKAGEEFSWNDDGTWLWEHTGETLMNVILPEATIRSGTNMPGMASVSFQQKIDNEATARIVKDLTLLKTYDSLPYPQVWLTREEQARVDELQYAIGSYAERQMVWFVAGDTPINDETWAAFCAQVRTLGIDEAVTIWQSAADRRK